MSNGRRIALGIAMIVAMVWPGAQVATADGRARPPILFVHGYTGSAANWDAMVARFRADGWPASKLRVFTYDSNQTNVDIAALVQAQADALRNENGAAKIDIIAHSMGSLSSRHYLKFLGGTGHVDDWVSIAGPNHGTLLTNVAVCSQPVETQPRSCSDMDPLSPFLANLNSGDETPGAVNYAVWYSPCDEAVHPSLTSPPLSGAANTLTACLSHNGLRDDATVYAQIRDFVR